MKSQYDEEIIRLFVSKDRQEGLLFKLSRPNRWHEAINALTHAIEFDPRCMTQLTKKPKVDELCPLLIAKGAGKNAYLFTNNKELHGQIVPLRDALKAFVGRTAGALIYCFEGQIGYYEADGWEGYFIIHRVGKGK